MKRHILIDGNNLLHRAFHVFVAGDGAPRLSSDSGYPTGMIYGPLSMLADWMPTLGRFDAVHFFRDGVPSRRRAMDPEYKRREPDRVVLGDLPDRGTMLSDGFEAKSEVDVLLHVLQLLGVSMYADSGEEADDLIASFIKRHPDDVHVIISSDKDFFQLLSNPRVVIYRPGSNGPRLLDAEGAEKHWATLNGGKHPPIPSESVRMFKSLCGDPSDNVPGVPRLRKKVVDSAIVGRDSVDKLAAAGWPGFSDTERSRAQEMIDRVRLNWRLVGLIDDLSVEPVRGAQPNPDAAAAVLRDLSVRLDMSFLTPGSMRMIVSDVPAKVLSDDWTASI